MSLISNSCPPRQAAVAAKLDVTITIPQAAVAAKLDVTITIPQAAVAAKLDVTITIQQAAVAAKLDEQQQTIRTLQAQLNSSVEGCTAVAEPSAELGAQHRQELERVSAAAEKAMSMERLKTQALLVRMKELERVVVAAKSHGADHGAEVLDVLQRGEITMQQEREAAQRLNQKLEEENKQLHEKIAKLASAGEWDSERPKDKVKGASTVEIQPEQSMDEQSLDALVAETESMQRLSKQNDSLKAELSELKIKMLQKEQLLASEQSKLSR